jgi:hypothetical protein
MADGLAALDRFDHLGRYWDGLVRGEPVERGDLDPSLVEALRRFQELGTTPPPGSARDRVWRDFRGHVNDGRREPEALTPATAPPHRSRIAPPRTAGRIRAGG